MSDSNPSEFQRIYKQVLALGLELRWGFIEDELTDKPEIQARLKQLFSPSGEDLFLIPAEEQGADLNEADIQDGIQLGDFQLIRELGRGGMGVVYLAEQQSLGRQVALKLFRPMVGANCLSREDFVKEARAIAKLRHPGVVPVYTVGEAAGFPYFALEYVPGVNFAEEIAAIAEGHPNILPPHGSREYFPAIARVCAEIAEALAHAHGQDLLHRDIKPSNILLDEDGVARLTDFGLAKSAIEAPGTISAELKGTVHYMSPEQVRTRRPQQDARSDVYSLGVVLYEALGLRKAFPGPSFTQVLSQIQRREPTPIRKLDPRVPRDLVLICETAMAKRPEDRYASAAALAADLRCFIAHEAISVEPPSLGHRTSRWLRRNRLSLSVTAVALAAGCLGVMMAGQWRDYEKFPRLSIVAVDSQWSRVDKAGRVSVRKIDVATGQLGPLEELGQLPMKNYSIAPGYYRIIVHFDDDWFTEHARDLRESTGIEIRSVHRDAPYLAMDEFETVAAGELVIPLDAPDLWPLHGVTLQLPGYQLSRTEATIRQYRDFLSATGASRPEWWQGLPWNPAWDKLPITLLTWEQFRDFAEWAGARLPTLAEWQRAAFGAKLRKYTWPDFEQVSWRGNTQGEMRLTAPQLPGTREDFLWVTRQLAAIHDHRGDLTAGAMDQVPQLKHLLGNVSELTETMVLSHSSTGRVPNRRARYSMGGSWESSAYASSLQTIAEADLDSHHRQSTEGIRLAKSLIP